MNNFGINLLGTVQTVIGKQEYQLKKWLGKTTNAAGFEIDEYAEPADRSGSVQPVSRSKYENMGLDFSKLYIKIFDVQLIDVLNRTENADQIIWQGGIYKAMPNMDWSKSGSWNSVLCVRVSDA